MWARPRSDLGQFYSLVIIPFRPFQHLLTAEDLHACLRSVHMQLFPGCELILDLFNPSLQMLVDDARFSGRIDEPEFTALSGELVKRRIREMRRNVLHQLRNLEMIYDETNPDESSYRFVESVSMRHLFRRESR